jgi:hypothetical protein
VSDATKIYALIDPRTAAVRYVGKADNPYHRLRRHVYEGRSNAAKCAWFDELRALGLWPEVRVLETVPREQWEERERHWIATMRARGADLLNICEGGNGLTTHTAETREFLRHKFAGRPPAQHVMEAAHAACRGKPNWRRGRKMFGPPKSLISTPRRPRRHVPRTLEWNAKIAAALKGRARPPEIVVRCAAGHRGLKRTPEQRAAMSAARKGRICGFIGRPHTPATRAKIGAASRLRRHTDKSRRKLSSSITAWHARRAAIRRYGVSVLAGAF